MLAGFIFHLEGTASDAGTFRAMTDGTVTKMGVGTSSSLVRDVTGRDPFETSNVNAVVS